MFWVSRNTNLLFLGDYGGVEPVSADAAVLGWGVNTEQTLLSGLQPKLPGHLAVLLPPGRLNTAVNTSINRHSLPTNDQIYIYIAAMKCQSCSGPIWSKRFAHSIELTPSRPQPFGLANDEARSQRITGAAKIKACTAKLRTRMSGVAQPGEGGTNSPETWTIPPCKNCRMYSNSTSNCYGLSPNTNFLIFCMLQKRNELKFC